MRAVRLLAVIAAHLMVGDTAKAQRRELHGNDLWIGVTGEQRIAARALLTFTAEERRTAEGRAPRQLFGLLGLLADVGHGVRVGAGYSRWHTSANSEFGPLRPSNEHRTWQQLTGAHRLLGATWNHRFRYEQRLIAPTLAGGVQGDWAYSTRARHQLRVVRPLDGKPARSSSLYVMPNVEVFVKTTNHHGVFFDQSRLGAAVGFGVAPRLNLEVNAMRQSQIRTDGVHERHDVLQLTARVLPQTR